MYTGKLHPGSPFPVINAALLSGEVVDLASPREGIDWSLIVVYRGRHCPLCTKYLNDLDKYISTLEQAGVDTIAVSADSKNQLEEHLSELNISYPIAYGLSESEMEKLGLFISKPRSENETNHYFSEPGLFIVNDQRQLQIIDISNTPFSRPNLKDLVSGIQWIRFPDNNYPIRGTHKPENRIHF